MLALFVELGVVAHILGSLRNHDGDAEENVDEKLNLLENWGL